jgi:hypothetical protein
MTMYSFVVPPEYLGRLAEIREETGTAIRRQIVNAIEEYLLRHEESKPPFLRELGPYRRPGRGEVLTTESGDATVVRVKGYGEKLCEMAERHAPQGEMEDFAGRVRELLGSEDRYFECLVCYGDGDSEWMDWSDYLALKNGRRGDGHGDKIL